VTDPRTYPHAMPAAPRIRPADLFSPDDWAPFQTRRVWAGPLLVAHCWGVIALAVAAAWSGRS
jgi:hypothetical protein